MGSEQKKLTNTYILQWVTERYTAATTVTESERAEAQALREAVRRQMDGVLAGGGVVCLPTAPSPAPLRGLPLSQKKAAQQNIIPLTCIAGTTGRPQLNLPLAEVNGLPVGLSLLGPRGADELLIGFAMEIERALAA